MLGACTIAISTPAFTKDLGTSFSKERFQVHARGIIIAPGDSSTVTPISGKTDVSTEFLPEVGVTYFFTPNIAADLIASTAKHAITHNAAGDLGTAWILPPTITLQYHFTPDHKISSYVDARLNYSLFYGEDEAAGFTDLDVGGGLGYALITGSMLIGV